MPGTVHRDRPEGKTFYRIDEAMMADDLDGPLFSFAPATESRLSRVGEAAGV